MQNLELELPEASPVTSTDRLALTLFFALALLVTTFLVFIYSQSIKLTIVPLVELYILFKIAEATSSSTTHSRSARPVWSRSRTSASQMSASSVVRPSTTMNGVKAMLKKGAPTESLRSKNISAISGQSVPKNTTKHDTASRMLLTTSALSRLTMPKTPFASIAEARAA